VKGFIVPATGATPDIDELRAHVRRRLAAYQAPRQIKFVAEVPLRPPARRGRPDLRVNQGYVVADRDSESTS
jgi:acyl-coenzyme A synthetase/AMP-(fatty) acid ligase